MLKRESASPDPMLEIQILRFRMDRWSNTVLEMPVFNLAADKAFAPATDGGASNLDQAAVCKPVASTDAGSGLLACGRGDIKKKYTTPGLAWCS